MVCVLSHLCKIPLIAYTVQSSHSLLCLYVDHHHSGFQLRQPRATVAVLREPRDAACLWCKSATAADPVLLLPELRFLGRLESSQFFGEATESRSENCNT